MFQRKYLIFLSVLVLLAFAWACGWFWMADRLRTDIDEFVGNQKSNGVTLTWEHLRVSGFPIRFDTDFTAPAARLDSVDRTVTWTGANTSIRPFIEGPGVVSFRAPGQHNLDIREPGFNFSVQSQSNSLEGRLGFNNRGQIQALRGLAEPFDLVINGQDRIGIARAAFDIERLPGTASGDSVHPDPVTDTLAVVLDQIDLSDLAIDDDITKSLGNEMTRVAADLSLRGPLKADAISPEALARWRDAGGTIEIESLELVWGPLRFAGDGTLAVDNALQPVGSFSARISGLDKLIDLLEQRGQLRKQQAAIARIAIAVLTRTPANGGPPEARVPVTIQDRMVSIGPVPLLQLDPIVWN